MGDIIVYRIPKGEPGAGKQVIHRVVGGDAVSGYTTKGDNRESADIWHPQGRDVVGRVVTIVPQGGKVMRLILDYHNLGLVALALLAWAVWPARSQEDDGESDTEASPQQAPTAELVPT